MKLHEEVYQKLKSTIINNKFYPGMRLDEKELCNIFGVSRTPIRESFQRLMQEGFIDNKGSGRGFFVKRIKIEDMVEVLLMREVLEGLAVRQFTESAKDKKIRRLVEIMNPFTEENLKDMMEDYIIANVNFHKTIIEGSHNSRLISTIRNLYDHLAIAKMRIIALTEREKKSLLEHKNIIKAILNKNSYKAEMEMRFHVSSLRKDFLDNIEKFKHYWLFNNYSWESKMTVKAAKGKTKINEKI